ncbi:IolB protein, partial [Pseudomonas coronafaciens pv. garcae]
MSLLTKSKPAGRDIVALAPGTLEYVGFKAYRLESGERLPLNTEQHEVCVVVLAGHVSVSGEAPGQGA